MSDTYTQLVECPARADMNTGFTAATHGTMMTLLGKPGALSTDCSDPTNAHLITLIETRDVGPFRVTGLKPALDSLASIFAAVKSDHPILYADLGTEGMCCCRAVRGSTKFFSNHSWGSAIDIKVGGILPNMNAKLVPRGFVDLYPYFHANGWFWGAGYNGRTDPMHFEVTNETIKTWKQDGKL